MKIEEMALIEDLKNAIEALNEKLDNIEKNINDIYKQIAEGKEPKQ